MEFCPQIAGIDNDRQFRSSNTKMPPARELGDRDLMNRLCAGDEDAFTSVFRRWQAPLFRFALHMSGNRTVAEDATQETFMTLIRKSAKFDPERGALGAFLFGIARNQVLKRLERERPYASLVPTWEDTQASGTESRIIAETAHSDDACRTETIEMVREAILTLPSDYREVVALCDLEEMSYDEAAAVLGCASGTVASRLHRGRTLLSAKLRSARAQQTRTSNSLEERRRSSKPNRSERAAVSMEAKSLFSQNLSRLQAQKAPK
jgi:RNA polymerase sigma-70 factor, ECF subfamily